MLDGDTLYTRFGDWPGMFGFAAIVWMLIRRRDADQ
jgi:hypothetical protein